MGTWQFWIENDDYTPEALKARDYLKEVFGNNFRARFYATGTGGKKTMKADEIITKIATHFNISKSAIYGTSRAMRFALPRHIAFYMVREYTKLSYPQIAMIFNRDHTSIMHGRKRISEILAAGGRDALEIRELINFVIDKEDAAPTIGSIDAEDLPKKFTSSRRPCSKAIHRFMRGVDYSAA